MKKELSEIYGIFDRCRLVLLENKQNKSFCERLDLKYLKSTYLDNSEYAADLMDYLKKERYIDIENPLTPEWSDDTGKVKAEWKNLSHKPYTTDKGVKYIKMCKAKSEKRKSARGNIFKWAQLIGIIIAALAGVITIAKFIIDLIR